MSSQNLLRRALLVFALTSMPALPATAQVTAAPDAVPEFVPYVNDLQVFDQPDLSAYGNGPRVPVGYFGSAEYLNWSQVAPPLSVVGQSGTVDVVTPGVHTDNSGTLTLTALQITVTSVPVITVTGGTTTITTRLITIETTIVDTTGPASDPSVSVSGGLVLQGMITQTSSLNTSFIGAADYTSGGRFEFGRMDEDARGWLISGFCLGPQAQSYDTTNATVNFANSPVGFIDFQEMNLQYNLANGQIITDGIDDDLDRDGTYGRFGTDLGTPAFFTLDDSSRLVEPLNGDPDLNSPADFDDAVPLPTRFTSIHLENKTSTTGVEAMRIWQAALGPRGGVWELFLGPRALYVNDQFYFDAIGAVGLNGTSFNTDAQNWLIGGQLGGRWSRQVGRVQFGVETRVFAAANYQHVTQTGSIGSLGQGIDPRAIINVQLPTRFSHTSNQTEFAPGGELRLNLKYQMFRSLYLQAGYTALFVNNIARSSKMNFYSLPSMGIVSENNKSDFLLHGFNLGIVINR